MRLKLMLDSAHHGIDFTDEGYYLAWIANPWVYAESVTQFGFIYHPLFQWLGEDVARLRQVNILITFVMAWIFVLTFFRAAISDDWPDSVWRSWPMLALATVFATAYPNLLNVWLPTPSYNSLALQALLVSGTGLLLMHRRPSRTGLAGAALLGIGGWLAFMAKPTTGGAIAVVSLVYLWAAGKLRPWPVVLAALVATLMLFASAVWIDGAVLTFLNRLSGAVELSRLMGVEQPLWRLFRVDIFWLKGIDLLVFLGLGVAVVYMVGVDPWRPMSELRRTGSNLLLAFLLLCAMALLTGYAALDLGKSRFQGMLAFAPALGAAIAAGLMWRTRWAGEFSRKHLSIAALLAVLPHVYAFGTGNNYWQTGQTASMFWVLSGLTILMAAVPAKASWQIFLPVAVVSQWVAVVLLQVALTQPYRQPEALGQANSPVSIGAAHSKLLLSADYARYVEAIEQTAARAGFRSGTPVIDLTGHSPGSLFVLGAHATGQAWLLGGYVGSDRYAAYVLARVSCAELADAWILTEESGPRKLSKAVLKRTGLELEQAFELVGEVRSPDGFGDYPKGSVQRLYRPSGAPKGRLEACELARAVLK